MSKENREKLAVEFITGYANGFITDQECGEMMDLTLVEITTIK